MVRLVSFFDSHALLARSALGQSHIFLCLVDVQAKEFFFVGTSVVSGTAFNDSTKSPIDALHTVASQASGNRLPKIRDTVSRWVILVVVRRKKTLFRLGQLEGSGADQH